MSAPTIHFPTEAEEAAMRADFLARVIQLNPEDKIVSQLAAGIALFNTTFGYDLLLPIDRESVISAATIAGLRGRPDVAQALRDGLDEAMEVVR